MTTQQTTRDRVEVTKQQLNEAIQALAAKDRPAAVEILGRYGVLNTTKLQREFWRAVFEAVNEALKKFDASTP